MSARQAFRKLFPFLLLALLGALVARRRAPKPAAAPEPAADPLLLPAVQAAFAAAEARVAEAEALIAAVEDEHVVDAEVVESVTEEMSLAALLAAAGESLPGEAARAAAQAPGGVEPRVEQMPVELELSAAEAVPEREIAVSTGDRIHIVAVVDDLLDGRFVSESASMSG